MLVLAGYSQTWSFLLGLCLNPFDLFILELLTITPGFWYFIAVSVHSVPSVGKHGYGPSLH